MADPPDDMSTPLALPEKCPRCGKATSPEQPFCAECDFDLLYGDSKRKRRGKCLYCRKIDNLSNEHVLGAWLIERYGRRLREYFHTLRRPTKIAFFANVPEIRGHNTYLQLSMLWLATACGISIMYYVPGTLWPELLSPELR